MPFVGGRAGQVECQANDDQALSRYDESFLHSIWASTPAGLYLLHGMPAPGERIKLNSAEIALPTTPREYHPNSEQYPWGNVIHVVPRSDQWCMVRATGTDYGSGSSLCFAHGTLTSGDWYWEPNLDEIYATSFRRER